MTGSAPTSGFLQKPYTPEALSRAVRHVLDDAQTIASSTVESG